MVSLFRRCGVEADLLPRSKDPDLTLARRYINGEECLPLIQNLEDFLAYLQQNGVEEGTVFFQGWACGPCRYGLYAPTQTLTLDRAGYGPGGSARCTSLTLCAASALPSPWAFSTA